MTEPRQSRGEVINLKVRTEQGIAEARAVPALPGGRASCTVLDGGLAPGGTRTGGPRAGGCTRTSVPPDLRSSGTSVSLTSVPRTSVPRIHDLGTSDLVPRYIYLFTSYLGTKGV